MYSCSSTLKQLDHINSYEKTLMRLFYVTKTKSGMYTKLNGVALTEQDRTEQNSCSVFV